MAPPAAPPPGQAKSGSGSQGDFANPGGSGEKVGPLVPATPATRPTAAPDSPGLRSGTPEDQAALTLVATRDRDWNVRRAAVARLTSQTTLAQVAISDKDVDIRLLAVSRLTEQVALARVALGDKDWTVRKSAVDRLTDRSVLGRIAQSDRDPDIRKLAVGRLADAPPIP